MAFVFSAPGAKEKIKPIAGATGVNLDRALKVLNGLQPNRFPHRNRYGYRITNAYDKPLYKAQDERTEAAKREILTPENITRVKRDLAGAELVILCGTRARFLKDELAPHFNVIPWWHTSTQALVSLFHKVGASKPTPSERAEIRAEAWAQGLLDELEARSRGLRC